MVSPLWSWALTTIGVIGLLIAGNGTWQGWAVNICAQGAWITYGVVSGQPGFIVSGVLYAAVYVRNARKTHARAVRTKEG